MDSEYKTTEADIDYAQRIIRRYEAIGGAARDARSSAMNASTGETLIAAVLSVALENLNKQN